VRYLLLIFQNAVLLAKVAHCIGISFERKGSKPK